MKNKSFETNCVHGNYIPENAEPQVLPIVQSTVYRYYNTEDLAALFNLQSADNMYSRISNPTTNKLEEKMAMLEGGTAAVATASGQAATMFSILNIASAGDHVLSSSSIYGGTYNLLAVTLKKFGVDFTFFNQDMSADEIMALAQPNTKAIFVETLANPALMVLDFDKFSKIAKKLGLPLIVDNTLATPALCRPFEHGADVVIHSTTKYSDGHASTIGGMVIDGGTFDWAAAGDKFPGMVESDASYHGLKFYETFGNVAYAVKIRAQLLRDIGATMSPMTAYLTHQGLQTLHLRMERHSQNALQLAEYLQTHPMVDWVRYPGLKTDQAYDLSKKYMPDGAGGVITFGVKGGRKASEKAMENLKLTSLVVHVGDVRTCVLQPASTSHRQLSDEEQLKAGIKPELVRISVGIENIDDIKEDFNQALNRVK
ncbi:MAG: O-acetylhomoserine aminocarboxypropyltransferase/cysteine synthase [Clostridiales bacterium]|nr:O-acetylhomoserine aminocarboxypropyltransferase/cysteine synthase [Clostridiales bacterium]